MFIPLISKIDLVDRVILVFVDRFLSLSLFFGKKEKNFDSNLTLIYF